MSTARTTEIILETTEYFVAHLDNGGVRVGMFEICAVDFPSTHPEYQRAVALTTETVEEFCDEQVSAGRWCIVG